MPTPFNQSVIDEFRANGGKVGGPFEDGDLLLLTTTGARSGEQHTTPLGYVRDDGLLLVTGSNLGGPRHPDWYHNVLAHPTVTVELGTDTFEAVAVPAEGERRDRLFERIVAADPGYGEYRTRTDRILPVVVLERPAHEADIPEDAADFADKMLQVHLWLRGQLRHVREETDAYFAALGEHRERRGSDAPPAPGLGLQIRQHCLAFCDALEFHHSGEDAHLFPTMAGHHPELRDTFDRLTEEHRSVARIQGELAALLADVGGADPERFRAELTRMSQELTAHLDYEEEALLPILAELPWPPGPPA
ncbi:MULTISPECIES: nitroreductase/quinone reductase family protein [unclassified Streptomyces]|uniref:nitroreductase/quinone reductase family protein n=1 Tax=unclassified Streptomyces TaxID=2593676 RepID=UPI00136C313D|nr:MULTISPECIES: nitroreductase/quinone reductase family protein [unclassified Streptomyces]NDZ98093.1 nitroreductase family deazaflavin-dependent oxidoreductase [Streptomyces sp. SID10116]MYY84104.1 nitroreductase family deazaflavin-dependent oxidoreductase [Streptomyces sp. SID335]MYZ12438.1 nitroreductase family deazaflavin-dependent oxidoreductase [Streptomyces sp. SID337]NDZ85038.1 nitroreductase family deazaflavin-dependent oxidoreductase [Streptomyces sp. SID10115]NEB42845.1 nitroreduct